VPGVSHRDRIPDDGLLRLERQLRAGTISAVVLKQWVLRYGDAAKQLIDRYVPADNEKKPW